MDEKNQIFYHNIPPVFDSRAKILILGSFPSVRSRETAFFYGHPQNRFWPMLAAVFNEKKPETVPEKKSLVLRNGIALWDIVKSCAITGSGDSTLKPLLFNDISPILTAAPVRAILANGKKAYSLLLKNLPEFSGATHSLPSTSPANAARRMESLAAEWGGVIRRYL